MSLILYNLFLGDAADASDMNFLKRNNITDILIVAKEFKPVYPKTFNYMKIEAEDSEDFQLIKYFDMMTDFINAAIVRKGCVFVHCAMGISRSPTAVIAYLMRYQKMNMKKARKLVESRRSYIFPNQGFIIQLEEYEKNIEKHRHPWKVGDKQLSKSESMPTEKKESFFSKLFKNF